MIVTLNPEDALAASSVATAQMVRKIAAKRGSDHGGVSDRSMRERWADGIHGAMAEIAACRAFNLAWTPGGIEVSHGDVGGRIEVRATEHASGHLLIYETDKEHSLFVLAIGHYPCFRITKPIRGSLARIVGDWRQSDPPCWWVSQQAIEDYGVSLTGD